MVLEGLRGYLQLASGLTDVTRERARTAARALVAQSEAVVPPQVRAQVSSLTDELLATSKTNRNLLMGLVRGEVERSVARLGLVSVSEVEAANRRADRLEVRVRDLEMQLSERTARNSSAKTAAAKTAAAKSTASKSSSSTTGTAKKAGAAKTSGPGKAGS